MSGLHRSSSAPLKNGLPPQELLDDLCSRFVLNVPKEDQQSFERILFLVEYAHWFYEDNSVENNPSLKSFTLKEFTSLMFNSCDVLRPYVAHIDDIFKDFTSYKVRVPVTGAIILDESYERCLLVKGWKGTSWSFPRGKKNKDEEDHTCAIRELKARFYQMVARFYWILLLNHRTSVIIIRQPFSLPSSDELVNVLITTALAPITATVVTATTLVTMATFIHPSNVVSVAPSTTILEAFHHNSHFEQVGLSACNSSTLCMVSLRCYGVGDSAVTAFSGSPKQENVCLSSARDLVRFSAEDFVLCLGSRRILAAELVLLLKCKMNGSCFLLNGFPYKMVLEETGFDVSKLLNKDEYIEMIFGQQRVRLYIVAGVKDDTAFAPLTKKEISLLSTCRKLKLMPKSHGQLILRISLWKAKNSSTGSSSMITENQPTKPVVDTNSMDTGPGRSFRNFRFDTNLIIQAMETAFFSGC
ncbi:hypothetical protein RHGRI_007656 [Rhododendron griersonianum]|uniref:mRNA decapping protein 2 Box A domain-containing protein n=1 Tax=Rhododendron griersonianum TaxID=479676 RepID=A0AAV6KYG7_9ERIC|nr:hypothetical protein RHGRI_007656 [Rhododendron griersonianum]